MNLIVEIEQEEDGRWIAKVVDLPGVMAYGQSREDAGARVRALAMRVFFSLRSKRQHKAQRGAQRNAG